MVISFPPFVEGQHVQIVIYRWAMKRHVPVENSIII